MKYYYTILILLAMTMVSCQWADGIMCSCHERGYDVYEKLDSLEIDLVKSSAPIANYVNAVQSGNLIFLAGKGPKDADGQYIKGKLGSELTVEQGYEAAKAAGILQLSALHDAIGDLNKVNRIVKVTGMVNAVDSFEMHPEVINGFSDLMVAVFGESGKHARAAVGMSSLPRGMACEIDMIVELRE